MNLESYVARYDEEPGYLDYARLAPVGRAVREEQIALQTVLARARFGSLATLDAQHDRLRTAISVLSGFAPDQVVFQPNASQALMHVAFGLTGGIALPPAESPALTFAVQRAAAALGVLTPVFLETDHGKLTPGNLREQLEGHASAVVAIALSLVDDGTGFLADLEGIRQVIGDRLLIVDASQGFGIVDAPFAAADVVVVDGCTWMRAGTGTGFLAASDRALDHLAPVWSGFVTGRTDTAGGVPEPLDGAAAFQVSRADPVAAAQLAAAAEEIAGVGVTVLNSRIAEHVSRIVALADEFAVPVVSPRAEPERAGIVALAPPRDRLAVLTAALHNHGVSATLGESGVRLSAHATVDDETFAMLRAALLSYSTAG